MNTQPIEKQVFGGGLEIVEIFKTIQGEGVYSGRTAVFVRLAGCNLQCPFCDTNYTSNRICTDSDKVFEQVVRVGEGCDLVVITGGEPFRQDISSLISILLEVGYTVQIETNGTLHLEDVQYEHPSLHICCSPKTPKVNAKLLPHIKSWKYVVDSNSGVDGVYPNTSLGMQGKPFASKLGKIFVQPMDEKSQEKNLSHLEVAKNCVLGGKATLSIQIHKIIGVV